MRVFAAIALSDAVRDHLARALSLAEPTGVTRSPWIPSVNWHITLAFYGYHADDMTDELLEHLGAAAAQTDPFPVALAGAGVFHQDTCWVGVVDSTEALPTLAEASRGAYAGPPQHAINRFHVTVARAGRRSGRVTGFAGSHLSGAGLADAGGYGETAHREQRGDGGRADRWRSAGAGRRPNRGEQSRSRERGRRPGRQPSPLASAMSALAVYRGPEWIVDRLELLRSDLGEGVGGYPLYTSLGQVMLGRGALYYCS
ncbi:MAG: 2'-5' RNA ligase family protein [Propionibacteriaceae bacterium]|jgi:2'-5' RNA ligase|nr:2'-5' RNA ligase family protein [Propionibacteriaceae bacterium]